jgi:DNA integrity scanning protein DisA with diadenylate cyclase activity
MRSLNAVIVESACMIANEIQARALFVYADVLKDYPIPSGILGKNTDVVLVTHMESTAEPSAEVTSILRLPAINLTRMAQIKLAVIIGVSEGYVASGDKIVCLTGVPAFGCLDCIVVLDIGKERELLIATQVSEIAKYISSAVFETLLSFAVEIASQGREGKPVGTTFVIGDHQKVMQFSRQTIFNPFHGYPEEERNILNPQLWETLKEFAALDGAFVLRDDGVVLCAGRHLSAALDSTMDLPQGLGSRHVAAAGITSVTDAIAIVISESTGDVRIFKNGTIFMEIEKPSR